MKRIHTIPNDRDHDAKGFKELYRKYVQSGMAINQPMEYGGGAPSAVAIAISEMATACNKSFSMCPPATLNRIALALRNR